MTARLTRIVGSLALVIGLYWCYALAIVPLIEPSAQARSGDSASESDISVARDRIHTAKEAQANALRAWFTDGDWELTSPKILETSQGMVLVKNYRNLGDGRVEIKPCTMIFLSENSYETEEERQRRAIILRAPQGAILQFDSAFDLKQAKVGKPTAGKLLGEVTIRSDQRDPGPQDDLLIRTRDLDLSERQLWTSQPVDFQMGPNYGHGRAMQIDMAPQRTKIGFRGMTRLQLSEHVEMHIHPGGSRPFPGGKASGKPNDPRSNPPVEIRCRGPFRFDFVKNVATFEDHVDVLRINPSGPSDQLTCQTLAMHFEATPSRSQDADDKSASNLQAVRVEAMGNPVVIQAPSSDAQARGQHVEYDLKGGGVTLRGEREVELRQQGREIHAREVFFQPDEQGKIGRFIALGHGWLRGTRPEDKSQQLEARWTRRLHFRPYEENHLLSIEGNAHLNMVGRGVLDAEEIYFWLVDGPAPTEPNSNKLNLVPDRLMAVGHVKIDSPQMTGAVGQLQAWFEQAGAPQRVTVRRLAVDGDVPLPLPAVSPMLRGPALQPSAPAMVPPSAPPVAAPVVPENTPAPPPMAPSQRTFEQVPVPPMSQATPPADAGPLGEVLPMRSRFDIQGELCRVRIKMNGQVADVKEVIVEHNVRFTELEKHDPTEKPLLVTGQRLHAVMPEPQAAVVTVNGQPAYVEARGMTLSSGAIHLDRLANTVWTDSDGLMTLPADRDLDGKPVAGNGRLEVTWQGQMHFDGRLARFTREVVARQGPRSMRTQLLKVNFATPVSFTARQQPQTKPEVEWIACSEGVVLETREFEGPKLTSIAMLYAVEATVYQTTGNVTGSGPGWMRTVRIGSADRSFTIPGAPTAKKPADPKPDTPKGEGLSFLGIRFDRGLTGNLRRREMAFEGHVRTVYGPVTTWDGELDPDKPETWGEQGVMMTSDRLAVAEVPSITPDEHFYELEATGNTLVENTFYTARAARLTYAQAKELLVLEGDGRTDARLFRQMRVGAKPEVTAARKIKFWPSTNQAYVEGVDYLDLTTPPSANKTTAASAATKR